MTTSNTFLSSDKDLVMFGLLSTYKSNDQLLTLPLSSVLNIRSSNSMYNSPSDKADTSDSEAIILLPFTSPIMSELSICACTVLMTALNSPAVYYNCVVHNGRLVIRIKQRVMGFPKVAELLTGNKSTQHSGRL